MLRRISDGAVIILAIVFVGFILRANARLDGIEAALAAQRSAAPSRTPALGAVRNDGIAIGSPAAPVTLVQFTDYECPFCARFASETMPTIYEQYGETGKVRMLLRELPLPMHPHARTFAHASQCAAALTPRIHEFQQALYHGAAADTDSVLTSAAAAVELNEPALRECIASTRFAANITRDSTAAAAAGIRGTPAFLIGSTGDSIRGRIISGARPAADFAAIIDSALTRAPRLARQ